MIHQAKQQLVERTELTEIRQFEDNYGTIGYGLRRDEEYYVLVAKNYAHNHMASFISLLVDQYSGHCDFIFYNDQSGNYTVFDGKYLAKNGESSKGPSKKREATWYEIQLCYGANLEKSMAGLDRPTTLAGKNKVLSDYS
jgi:hypothetical protein